ncbi:MAG: 2Fe-2S iron-sulfur cluster-binding protein [Planctomycetota bacterium]
MSNPTPKPVVTVADKAAAIGDSAAKSGAASGTIEWSLNGTPVRSPAGATILEAALSHGIDLPHFCYHPGLSVAGNCRICLVETNRSPKPVISCSEKIAPGLEVKTHSAKAVEAREGVMEFQLINHPLDCPVCDKAGECTLQDYSYEHGPDRSRFVEAKSIRHTKALGPSIRIWGNRCIVCTRCVRFCDEIAGTGELCVVERGDRSIVDVFPGIPIDNPLAGNVVDICPVGALISTDFMFQSRVWNMEQTASVCGGCARGCNIDIETNLGYVKRLRPRHNPDVNQWWMCDFGRYDYRYVHDSKRLLSPRTRSSTGTLQDLNETAALEQLITMLNSGARNKNARGAKAVAIVIDPFLTCEELYLVKKLAASLGDVRVAGWISAPGKSYEFGGKFRISAEKYPNRAGAEAIIGAQVFGENAAALRRELESGNVSTALVFAGFPHADPSGELLTALQRANRRAVFSLFDGRHAQGAELLFASSSPFEKEGCYVNDDGLIQRVRSRVRPDAAAEACPGLPTAAHQELRVVTELEILQKLLIGLGGWERVLSATAVFRKLSDDVGAFKGLTHKQIAAESCWLPGARPAAAPAGGVR